MSSRFTIKNVLRWIHFYPPYLGAGISIKRCSEDIKWIEVQMKLRFWNKNYYGTHFGGSIYSMVDPWHLFLLAHNLGSDYVVWDKQAKIRFKTPGKGTLTARFEITDDDITKIKEIADRDGKAEPEFLVRILAQDQTVVAEVDKLLSVRRKDYIKAKRAERATKAQEHHDGLQKLHHTH